MGVLVGSALRRGVLLLLLGLAPFMKKYAVAAAECWSRLKKRSDRRRSDGL